MELKINYLFFDNAEISTDPTTVLLLQEISNALEMHVSELIERYRISLRHKDGSLIKDIQSSVANATWHNLENYEVFVHPKDLSICL